MRYALFVTNSIKSIAIGSFDGIHIAHRALIENVDALVIIERNGGYLTSGYRRSYCTDKICCFYHFDTIKSLEPSAFIAMLEADFPLLERIVVGYDFAFGKDKAGNAETLEKLYPKEVCIINEVKLEEISVHSRTIKAFLCEGDIPMTNRLLGRAYQIEGRVIRGQGLGKKALVPTLNLEVFEYQLPQAGVYATRTWIDGVWMDSISFLGHRVTTDNAYAIESHILGYIREESITKTKIYFVDKIRDNHKFESLNALEKQIKIDILIAKECLDKETKKGSV